MPPKKKLISLVIPVFKEEKNIPLLYAEIQGVLSQIKNYNFEIIFVNDGSSDTSWFEIEKLALDDSNVKGINLSRNFGKEVAITAGIEHAMGDAVITLDGDGQHPVEQIPNFIGEWEAGYQIVYNIRPSIAGASKLKKLSSVVFYKVFNAISEFEFEDRTTDYRLLDRRVVDYFLKFSERNRLYRGIIDWLGFDKKALVFDARERLDNGDSSYSYKKLWTLAINSLTSFSIFPLRLVGYFGFFMTLISSILFVFVVVDKLTINKFFFSNIAALLLINMALVGIVLMALGLIALYIARIHEEVQGRPMYIIKDCKNIKK
ncbi:glycosyltransferase family 2 protein [Candidatus Gracilibacteria bacterium]|nr:glycosyltransferase family 2 protein [Candidatus Gracilibacteria bacterium]